MSYSILRTVDDYNPSTLLTLGASWTILGARYVYHDLVFSDGNFSVGNIGDDYNNIYTGVNHVSANGNNVWLTGINLSTYKQREDTDEATVYLRSAILHLAIYGSRGCYGGSC